MNQYQCWIDNLRSEPAGKTISTTNGCGSADFSASNHQGVAPQTGTCYFVRKLFIAARVFALT